MLFSARVSSPPSEMARRVLFLLILLLLLLFFLVVPSVSWAKSAQVTSAETAWKAAVEAEKGLVGNLRVAPLTPMRELVGLNRRVKDWTTFRLITLP